MNDGEELLVKIIAWLILGVPIMLVALLPTWFVLQGDWNGYLYWVPWSIALSGYLYKLGIIVYPIIGLLKTKATYIFATAYMILLGVWGMPLLKKSLIHLVTTPLSGLELQRVILTIIIIKTLSLSSAVALKQTEGTES